MNTSPNPNTPTPEQIARSNQIIEIAIAAGIADGEAYVKAHNIRPTSTPEEDLQNLVPDITHDVAKVFAIFQAVSGLEGLGAVTEAVVALNAVVKSVAANRVAAIVRASAGQSLQAPANAA
jgi:hypothetical protein